MDYLYSDEPIIACSTCSLANAAIAVLRISGFQDLKQFSQFFTLDLGPIEPRRVYYTQIKNETEILDDICLTYFAAPKSYNGENVLELSIHGNTLNSERILKLFLDQGGCRIAGPGEFTYRAMKNRKLSLSQVEGLDLFLNANTSYALNQGLSLLSGNLNDLYQELYQLFLKHKSSLELSIDFSDDVGEETAKEYYLSSLREFSQRFETLYRRVMPQSQHLIQPEIVLAGLPNSGKSSMFNMLLADERAIVSSIPGTTRDYLSELIQIEGVRYKLVDTAGIRESEDLIEAEGIKRTRKKIEQSFFSILLINPFEMLPGFEALLENDFDLIYFTHADVPGFEQVHQNIVKAFPQLGPMGAISLTDSSRAWEKEVNLLINNKYLSNISSQPILLDRHKNLIEKAHSVFLSYENSATYENDVAILSSELNTLGHCLSELLGIISPDQVLNSIFSNFCIGK